jgi:type I restriction enzyme S subunit
MASAGDTLVTVRAPVGDINQAISDCCIGRGLASVQHKANLRSYTFYRFKNLRAEFEQFNGDGTLFGSVTGEGLRGIKHVEPPATIQAAFDEIAAKLDSKVEAIHHENDLLKKTRDTLLPALISGELELGNPESLHVEATAA